MKIIKYTDYVNESLDETPETLAEQALKSIRETIMKMFANEEDEESEDEVISFTKAKRRGEEKEKNAKKITFADYGTTLINAEISRLASSLTCKLDDGESIYTIIFFIDLKDAIPKDPSKDFSIKDIENCKVKIKKFQEGEEHKELPRKTVKIADINEEELIKLKLEIDGDETEELVIETE